MKVVALSSGGVDSSLMMLLMKSEGHIVLPLHIDYGHLARNREWKACRQICAALGVGEPLNMNLSGIGQVPSGLTDPKLNIEKDAFLPARNLMFVVAASAYAYSASGNAVAIGLLANPIFPDQTTHFVEVAQECINAALDRNIRLLAPLISLDKRDTLRLAARHNLPLNLTYYCHSGKEKPCGLCISCKERKAAEAYLLPKKQR